MSRARLAVALLALAAVLSAVAAPDAPAAPITPPGPYAQRLTLRLVDVGPGYTIGNDSGCGSAIAGEGAPWSVTQIYLAHRHLGCIAEFMELWALAGSSPRPGAISSAAYRFHDTAGPAAELRHARDVVRYVTGVSRASLRPLPAPAGLGDAALAFSTDDALVDGRTSPGAVVLWRSGATLALVLAGGLPTTNDEQAALRLAAIQQQRIEHPTPLRRSDDDDLEVPLDNPHLGIGVQWLGRRLDPPGPLPRLALTDAHAPVAPGDGPDWDAVLEYGVHPFGSDVRLGMWRRRAWQRFARTSYGRLVWRERCVHSERLAIPAGHAVVYAGYARRQTRCGAKRPDRFIAHVFLPQLVVSVNVDDCTVCLDLHSPYNSLAGMRAIVRALRPRVPRAFPPAPSAG